MDRSRSRWALATRASAPRAARRARRVIKPIGAAGWRVSRAEQQPCHDDHDDRAPDDQGPAHGPASEVAHRLSDTRLDLRRDISELCGPGRRTAGDQGTSGRTAGQPAKITGTARDGRQPAPAQDMATGTADKDNPAYQGPGGYATSVPVDRGRCDDLGRDRCSPWPVVTATSAQDPVASDTAPGTRDTNRSLAPKPPPAPPPVGPARPTTTTARHNRIGAPPP